ncbi:MAG: hypothetical protein KF849_01150 [Rhizobiaceae bacterium]|nr:hypothetical protein [Rhizobiaceae bacterium]
MLEYDKSTAGLKRSDAFGTSSDLPHSEVTALIVPGKFREWCDPIKIRVPWGRMEYWNYIASMESIGGDEPTNWQDNIFLHQEISIQEDRGREYWLIRGRCFFSFWNPPAPPSEPGVGINVRFLATLK